MQLKVSNMFKLGTSDAKINVTTWRGKVQIHVRKYFESKYDKKLYPSKQGIALTVQEWRDLKKQISVIDECIECSEYMLREEAGRMKPKFNRNNTAARQHDSTTVATTGCLQCQCKYAVPVSTRGGNVIPTEELHL